MKTKKLNQSINIGKHSNGSADKLAGLVSIINRDYQNMAGIVVYKNGEMVYENYFNECTAASTIHVFSVTKSIISILLGIAMDHGYIQGVEQKILDFFPEYKVKRGERTIQNITLRDMLTMTAPYKYKSAPYTKYFTSEDWVHSSLDLLGGRGQTGVFRYAPVIGPDILSGILVRATGQPVLDFARKHLFGPLGISVKESIRFKSKEEQLAFYKDKGTLSGWVADPMGTHTAGWGLTMTASELARIGQLCLDAGIWNGDPIVSDEWINESTSVHSRWEQQNLDYGYLWWIQGAAHKAYAAMGDGGNVIYVNVPKKLVVSIASLFVPRARDRMEFIKEYIEPAFSDAYTQ